MKNLIKPLAIVSVLLFSCNNNKADNNTKPKQDGIITNTSANSGKKDTTVPPSGPIADATTILARKEVPILCYHHIKPQSTNEYTVTTDNFKAQLKVLHDSGYHSILPDQLYAYLTTGAPLPEKPFMLTYDDTDEEQFSIAKPEMDKYGFKGVYFIMTISIGRPRYMTKEQIKQLADEGHTIGAHTWRHDRVDKYLTTPHIDRDTKKIVNNDWDLQLVDTRKKLEEICGKPIHYFAYPFGVWTKMGIPEIRKRGIKMAFQLSTKRDPDEPLYTVRRIIIPSISATSLLKSMHNNFH
ncbi:MAG: polysaccharide deacetylase [Chitinophagaceae bacterium]